MKNPFKGLENEIKKGINKLGDQVRSGINDLGNTIKREIEEKRKSAWNSLDQMGNKVKGDIEGVANKAKGEIESKANVALKEVEGIPGKVKDELEKAVEAMAKALTSEALKKVQAIASATHSGLEKLANSKPELIDEINGVSFSIEIGPVTNTYDHFYGRAEEISSLLSRPPAFTRTGIREFMVGVTPTSVDLGISVQLVAVVVGSKEFGLGGSVGDVSGKLAIELVDAILEAAGVPD